MDWSLNIRFFTPSSRRFIFSKLLQSKHTLNHDYMVGPQQGEDMGVARLVQWWAEWCRGRCHNTIYTEGADTPPGFRDLMMFVDNRFNVLWKANCKGKHKWSLYIIFIMYTKHYHYELFFLDIQFVYVNRRNRLWSWILTGSYHASTKSVGGGWTQILAQNLSDW